MEEQSKLSKTNKFFVFVIQKSWFWQQLFVHNHRQQPPALVVAPQSVVMLRLWRPGHCPIQSRLVASVSCPTIGQVYNFYFTWTAAWGVRADQCDLSQRISNQARIWSTAKSPKIIDRFKAAFRIIIIIIFCFHGLLCMSSCSPALYWVAVGLIFMSPSFELFQSE